MSHAHHHDAPGRRLALVLALTCTVAALEVVGGVISNSLALLADAGHMATDILALTVALASTRAALRPPNDRKTFGYQRLEILGALWNGAALLAIAVLIAVEAVKRLGAPPDVRVPVMAGVAAIGLAANLVAAALLHGGRGRLRARAAYYHVLGDLLGSVGALLAAGAIYLFGWYRADPVASLVIAAIVLAGAFRVLSDAAHVLLEGVPRHLDVERIGATLSEIDGVAEVHDMHVWSLRGTEPLLSAHLVVEHDDGHGRILRTATERLRERFGIEHVTLQLEPADFNIAGDVIRAIRDRR